MGRINMRNIAEFRVARSGRSSAMFRSEIVFGGRSRKSENERSRQHDVTKNSPCLPPSLRLILNALETERFTNKALKERRILSSLYLCNRRVLLLIKHLFVTQIPQKQCQFFYLQLCEASNKDRLPVCTTSICLFARIRGVDAVHLHARARNGSVLVQETALLPQAS